MRKFNYILNDLAFDTLVTKCLYGEPADEDVKECENQINLLKQENQALKENNMSMQEEMFRTWKKVDLYKEVIEEVRELRDQFIDENELSVWKNDSLINFVNRLLQILDKAKEMSNE